MSNVWTTLSAIDVSKHIEKKGQLSYLVLPLVFMVEGKCMETFPFYVAIVALH